MTFATGNRADEARLDGGRSRGLAPADAALEARAQRLLALIKSRDAHFRRAVMADSIMSTMLSLFLAEIRSVPLNATTLGLVTLLDGEDVRRTIDTLIHAGLACVTGENQARRTVGLSPLGSARMRSFITDHPDL